LMPLREVRNTATPSGKLCSVTPIAKATPVRNSCAVVVHAVSVPYGLSNAKRHATTTNRYSGCFTRRTPFGIHTPPCRVYHSSTMSRSAAQAPLPVPWLVPLPVAVTARSSSTLQRAKGETKRAGATREN
jgi:hypothetical protein